MGAHRLQRVTDLVDRAGPGSLTFRRQPKPERSGETSGEWRWVVADSANRLLDDVLVEAAFLRASMLLHPDTTEADRRLRVREGVALLVGVSDGPLEQLPRV